MNQKYISPLLGVFATGGIIVFRGMGAFQVWELHTFDWMMNHRIAEQRDDRVVMVGINEQDVVQYGQAVISDQMLADIIEAIKEQNPTVIGMDLFRNVPHDDGYERLQRILAKTPNIIGIEKVINDRSLSSVSGNSVLVQNEQVAASDLIVDVDGRVRRGFLLSQTR